ncbi:MAG: hypothetical protein JO148_05815 [Acidimicrobiia bacterium]|nr:hypothetical protein [Acidimicrobiia bacterium]
MRLRYTLTANGQTVSDTEYDILDTSTLAVGAAQNQTVYNVITVVVGTPVSQPDGPLIDWVSSTIRVQP